MIDYKLAKKLKDVGFPQKGEGKYYLDGGKGFLEPDVRLNANEGSLSVYIPTLSELIDACGDEFDALKKGRGFIMGEIILFKATGRNNKCIVLIEGKSPEEAVAKLYIKLNEK